MRCVWWRGDGGGAQAPGPRAVAVFTCWLRTRPSAEALLPALLPAHAQVGAAPARPQGTLAALAGAGGTSLVQAARQRSGTWARAAMAGGAMVPLLVGHGLGSALGWRGQAAPCPWVCEAVRGKGHAVCVCAGFQVCLLHVVSENLPPEQLHAAGGESSAQDRGGSRHGQVSAQLPPAGRQKGGKILFLDTQSAKQMKFSLLLGLILKSGFFFRVFLFHENMLMF